jgi:hypothetical protein
MNVKESHDKLNDLGFRHQFCCNYIHFGGGGVHLDKVLKEQRYY